VQPISNSLRLMTHCKIRRYW